MKARVEQMEREAAQLRNMQAGGYAPGATTSSAPHVGLGPGTGSPAPENEGMETEEDKEAADARSVYVGNVCDDDLLLKVCLTLPRWIMELPQRKYKHTFSPVVLSTE